MSYLQQAGVKASARSANREAAAYFERALAALAQRPETHETLEQGIDLRFDVRTALLPLNEIERGSEYLREAERLATRLDDQRRLGWAAAYMSANFWLRGRSADARAVGERAHAIAEQAGDFALTVAANYSLGAACHACGDLERAVAYHRKAVDLLEGERNRHRYRLTGFPGATSRSWLAWALAELGEFEEGIAHGREGIRVADSLDHPYSLIVACRGLARLYCVKGEFAEAIPLLQRGLALSREYNITVFASLLSSFLGYAYLHSGRAEEGRTLLQETLPVIEATGAGLFHSLGVVHLGEAFLLTGQLDAAQSAAERALTVARSRGERSYEAWALRLVAEIAARRETAALDTAAGAYEQAGALAEALGMRPLLAHCRLGLATLHRRAGRWAPVPEHLAAATSMFREMDMRFWLERAQADFSELGDTGEGMSDAVRGPSV